MKIEGIGTFSVDPLEVSTLRPDIFNKGYFSVFDVLAYLGKTGRIVLEYHFDSSMDTYVVDSINGVQYWWYQAHYDGGFFEQNALRMDYCPAKEKTWIRLVRVPREYLEMRYQAFRREVDRYLANGNRTVIPIVVIKGRSFKRVFRNVTVWPHGLRNDMFKKNVVTGIDVILSLADQGLINVTIEWFENVGSAVVQGYFITSINGDGMYGRCGFLYELGEPEFKGRSGNMVHLTSDIRVILCPYYVEWRWRCL